MPRNNGEIPLDIARLGTFTDASGLFEPHPVFSEADEELRAAAMRSAVLGPDQYSPAPKPLAVRSIVRAARAAEVLGRGIFDVMRNTVGEGKES